MEHWLPLFEEKLSTLFDHLDAADTLIIDSGALAAADERLSDIADYHRQRGETSGQSRGSYRPIDPELLYLTDTEFKQALVAWPIHKTSIFPEPDSDKIGRFRLPLRPRFHARTIARRECL